jgi:hypothetical protein
MYQVELVKTPLTGLERRLESMKKEHALPPIYLEEWHMSNAFSSNQFEASFIKEDEIVAALDANPTDVDKEEDAKTLKM